MTALPTPPVTAALAERVLAMVDLTPCGDDTWLGRPVTMGMTRVFGGQVLAQGLVAAGHTVTGGKTAHSLHAYFLRAGDPAEPIEYRVERVRDGRRLSSRQVTAVQHGRPIVSMTISFAATSGGVTHQQHPPRPAAPEDVPTLEQAAVRWGGLGPAWGGFEALEIRIDPSTLDPTRSRLIDADQSTDQVWQRVPFALPPDQLLHQAFLVYASDVTMLAAGLVPHGVPVGCEGRNGRQLWDGLSIDHAVWFHSPVRADEWMLFQQESPVAQDGRAFTRAQVYTRDGSMIASVAQEGLILDAHAGIEPVGR